MKAVITLLLILFVSFAAQAQNRTPERKAVTVQMELVQVKDIRIAVAKKESQVARLYRRSGSRVKKELNFATKNDRGMA
jgi:hypothetical protein